MENNSQDSFLASYRAFMTVLFVGVADALLGLIFNVAYRSTRPYFSSDIINVSYIIFGTLLIFSLIGLVYLLALKITRGGALLFSILMAALTVVLVLSLRSANLAVDPGEAHSLRTLMTGLVILLGGSAALVVPVLHRSHAFELYVV